MDRHGQPSGGHSDQDSASAVPTQAAAPAASSSYTVTASPVGEESQFVGGPHPSHEDTSVHTTSFRKPAPLAGTSTAMPPATPAPEVQNPSPASTPPPSVTATASHNIGMTANVPPITSSPSTSSPTPTMSPGVAAPAAHAPVGTAIPPATSTPQPYLPSNVGAGPSRKPATGSIQESGEEEEEQPVAGPSRQGSGNLGQGHPPEAPREPPHNRGVSMSSYGSGGAGNGNGGGNGSGNGNGNNGHIPPGHSASVRRPARTVSYNDRIARQTERYPGPGQVMTGPMNPKTLPPTPQGAVGSGTNLPGELNPEGLMSRRSGIDWIVPTMGRVEEASMGQGTRRVSGYSQTQTLASTGEKTVGKRIEPTLVAAKNELEKARRKVTYHGWALNIAIGAQVVLGALTTGIAAAINGRQASIVTSVLGGLSTIAASYLAKARGSGEPEASAIRKRELESFIRDCEAFECDYGHLVGPEQDVMINRYRRRFEEILGNGLEGVGETPPQNVKTKKRDMSEKNGSPV